MAFLLRSCRFSAAAAAWNRSSQCGPAAELLQHAYWRQKLAPGTGNRSCFGRAHCISSNPKPRSAHGYLPVTAAAGSAYCTVTAPRDSKNANKGQLLRALPSAEEVAAVTPPPLACSFPSKLHPEYEQVKVQCDEWIEGVAQLPSADDRRRLRESLLPRLVCRFVPHAVSRRRLLQAIKLIAWLMVADDDDDHPEVLGCDPAYTAQRSNCIMAILSEQLQGGRVCKLLPWRSGLSQRCLHRLNAFEELWEEIRGDMSPLLRSRFVASMADYLDGLEMQAILRNKAELPDVDSYMEIRRKASFTIPCFIMVEHSLDITLDAITMKNPSINDLCHKATDYISLWNDLVSCYKEINVGDFFNLPSIMYMSGMETRHGFQKSTSFQNAIDQVAQLALAVEAQCTFLINSLRNEYSQPFADHEQASNVFAYVEAMMLAMSGALQWFLETPRYQFSKFSRATNFVGRINTF